LIIFPRYLYPLFFPAILIIGAWLNKLFPGNMDAVWGRERLFFCAVICGYILMKCGGQYYLMVCADRPSGIERTVNSLLTSPGAIYTDSRTMRVLKFMEGYSERLHLLDFEGMPNAKIPESSRVLMNPSRIDFMHVLHGYSPPECYTNMPTGWKCEWRCKEAGIYRVDKQADL